MRAALPTTALSRAVQHVRRYVSKDPNQPIYTGIMITAGNDSLLLEGFDGDTAARASVPANVSQPGRLLVSGPLLASFASALPSGEAILDDTQGNRLEIRSGTAKFGLPLIDIADYPTLPVTPAALGEIEASRLKDAIRAVGYGVDISGDHSTPGLTAFHFEAGSRLLLAGCDRYRLHVAEPEWDPTDLLDVDDPIHLHPPGPAILDAVKHMEGRIVVSGDHSMFGLSDDFYSVITRQIALEQEDGKPKWLKFSQFLKTPGEYQGAVVIRPDSDDLSATLDRAALAREGMSPVWVQAIPGVGLNVHTVGASNFEEMVHCAVEGEELTFGCKPKYLKEAMAAVGGGAVEIHATTPKRPLTVFGLYPDRQVTLMPQIQGAS